MLKQLLTNGLLLFLYLAQTDAGRILVVIPTPSISHQVVIRPLVQELVKRGHDVTLVTTDPSYENGKTPANLTEIDVHDISYEHFTDILLHHKGNPAEGLGHIIKVLKRFGTIFDLQLQTPQFQQILKKPKDYFDVLILESCNRAALGLSEKFKAPIIQFSSLGTVSGHYGYLGAPSHPLLFPSISRQRLYNLSRWEKIIEIMKDIFVNFILQQVSEHDLNIVRKNFGKTADFRKIGKNIKLLLVNEHPIWADNRPLPPNIHYIGGIHQTADKELQKELKTYLDASKKGVIYMSLGTNVITSLLPEEKIEVITKVFARLPYDILLKWDKDIIPNQPPNVKVQRWFPQSTLLKHPNVKLFITQAGLQSTDEAINAGVPLLAIPMLGDQWYNAEKYVRHKIGMQLDIQTISEEIFHNAITTIVTDKSYKQNMLRLRTLMREYPIQPVELAAWWTEHIIKYGGDHLIPPSAYLHWSEYYEVELLLICLSVILATLFISIHVSKILIRIVRKLLKFDIRIKNKLE